MRWYEDYLVICSTCGGEDFEHRIVKCESCGLSVCSNCTAGTVIDGECCDDHPCDVHKGKCCMEINGVEVI